MSAARRAAMPRATYRVQFGPDFGFAQAAALAPYLARLGISHLYAAPVFAAMPGSPHGYDGIDPNSFNSDLGGEDGFHAMAAACRAEGLGLILDYVPNHLGVWGAENRYWLSVLEEGPASPYARWFDIDWQSDYPGLRGKLLAPVLGESYGAVLAAGGFEPRFDALAGKFSIWALGTHKLPVRPEDHPGLLAAAGGDPERAIDGLRGLPGDAASWGALDALIARQHWRAAKFDLDCDAINYRRFFTISTLAGLRVEDPEVFTATHQLVLSLLEAGVIDGLRIDHIDGLADPKAYLARLRASVARPFHLVVEKILAADEYLPGDWQADGTTGYEFANLVNGLLVDPTGTEGLSASCADFTGASETPADLIETAKGYIMTRTMAGEMAALAARLHSIAQGSPLTRDLGREALRAALLGVISAFDVYRTYADATGARPEDRRRLGRAVKRARGRAAGLDPALFDFLEDVLGLDLVARRPEAEADIRACVTRFQQLSGPVMAKGVEDTAFYRDHRLVALNEVGAEPGHYFNQIEDFHQENQERLIRNPGMLLTASTHDTKRGEDARARILAISGDPAGWADRVAVWHEMLGLEAAAVDRGTEYLFYQMLLGVWPAEWRPETSVAPGALADLRGRVAAALVKSAREAGLRTRWVFGNPDYEGALEALVARALDPAPRNAFLRDFRAFEAGLFRQGVQNSLIQTTLRLTVPGVPDIYQGAELWEQSLVDPDNRRPVDFTARAALLDTVGGVAGTDWPEGVVKFALIIRLLAVRREYPALFAEGGYQPLVTGDARVLAFLREQEGTTVLVAAALAGADTRAVRIVAPGRWSDLLDMDAEIEDLSGAHLFRTLPVAVLRKM